MSITIECYKILNSRFALEHRYNHIKTSSSSGNDDLNVTPTKNKCVTPTRKKTEREQVRPEIARSTSKMLKHVTPSSDLTDSTLVVTQLKNRTVKHVTPPTMTEHSSIAVTQLKERNVSDSTTDKKKNKKKKKKKQRLSSDSTKSFGSAKSESADQKQRDLRRWRRERDKTKPKKRNLKRSIAVGFESGEESEWSPGSEDEDAEEEDEEEVKVVETKKKKKKKKEVVENKDQTLSQVIERWRGGELNKSTVAQLKVVLKHFDCKISGRKAELVERTSEVLNVNYGSFAYVPQGEENKKNLKSTTEKPMTNGRRFGCDLTNDDADSMMLSTKSKKKKNEEGTLIIESSSLNTGLVAVPTKKKKKQQHAWAKKPLSMHSSKMR